MKLQLIQGMLAQTTDKKKSNS